MNSTYNDMAVGAIAAVIGGAALITALLLVLAFGYALFY